MRSAIEKVLAAAGLIVSSPLLAVIALAIKLEDGGPVVYAHTRVGRNFRRFGLFKFRTMVPNADRLGGPLTAAGDARVTSVGRILRRHKLDELPQLINVLKGDMQLVGVRPEVERYVKMFRRQYALILQELPGITDLATLTYRREEELLRKGDVEAQYISEILPRKLELSLQHSRHRTLRADLAVILRTLLWAALSW